ncbi:MAG: DUF2806 domain-containing protein [Syntrophobacteraceae bacterium]
MNDGNPLINIGDLAKPASLLIEKVSDAIGGLYRPRQIKRIAQAEAEAEKIRALAKIEIDDELQKRALTRFVAEETRKQLNIESITSKAIKDLSEDARPQDMEDDWIAHFFDRCKLISDEKMQSLWARVLAGEANTPGRFSKRTVNFLATLGKSDAEQFTSLRRFSWTIGNEFYPIVHYLDPIYEKYGLTFDELTHLDSIGLIVFEYTSGFVTSKLPKNITATYYDQRLTVQFRSEEDNILLVGHVLLTHVGHELASVCDSLPIEEFYDSVIRQWHAMGYVLSCEWPKQ